MTRSRVPLRVAIFFLMACLAAACREKGDVRVLNLTFRGNRAIDSEQLEAVLATQPSGWLPWSAKHYFDRAEFEQDLKRIVAFYSDRGYPNAKVTGIDVQFNDKRDAVNLRIDIDEGKPLIVREVALEGFDELSESDRDALRAQLPLKATQPRDRQLVAASRDLAIRTLRERGYAYATVRDVEQPLSDPEQARIAFVAEPGPKTYFGPVTVVGNNAVDESVIQRQLTFKTGDLFQAGRVTQSQRRLYGLELFQFALIEPTLGPNKPVEVPVKVTVAEGKHRRLQLGIGYGSEEKARATASWRHVNFFGGARTATSEVKWSSLEQGIRLGFGEPYFLRPGGSFQLSGSDWWTSEPTYALKSYGGRATVTNLFGSAVQSTADRAVKNELRTTYIREFEQYSISNEALTDPSLRNQLIALGLDPRRGTGGGTLSALEIDLERNTSTRPLDPHSGYVSSLHFETAGGPFAGSFHYNEVVAEGRTYLELGRRTVWANRVRIGTLSGADNAKIPFFKRYFLGGSTSLRGWGRYEVSPLSGSGLPIGGRSMLESSTELRMRLSRKLSGVAFIDAGNVWPDHWQFGNLRYAVGPGLRYDTPIGPMRADLGIQLNPIPGLLINGKPELRKWRVHFSIGQAF